MKVLANDGIAEDGKAMLEAAGFEVITDKIAQDALAAEIGNYDVLVVRSATKVTAGVLSNPGKLKLVVRAGVGIDNIDVKAAEEMGVAVSNTPNSSSLSVAELVFAHLFSIARFLHESNREMPDNGDTKFKDLKKKYAAGVELRGKTLGIIGFGRIGQETARIAIGLGMKVMVYNRTQKEVALDLNQLPIEPAPVVNISTTTIEEVCRNSDFISLHVPGGSGEPVLSTKEFAMMKKGVVIINCARGGVIKESELIKAMNDGIVAYSALDVFEGEPNISSDIVKQKNLSLSPHIGASTNEAQDRVSKEVAELIISRMNLQK